MTIQSFKDRNAETCFAGSSVQAGWQSAQRVAQRKLTLLHAADTLRDLAVPPGNHLEALSANRTGQHSIRINAQWRICFVWRDNAAHDVEITDYH